jgi:hypothetical protein
MLILEEEDDCVDGLQSAAASLGQELHFRLWRDAPAMIAAAPLCFAETCLISLDHDLQSMDGQSDPGTGLDVAEFLSLHTPMCPVILHAGNSDGRLAMQNRLRAAGWTVATVLPREADWIQSSWLPVARRLIGL